MDNYKFYIDDYANELKQHLNLSESAWLVISEDIKDFYISEEKESFSGFLNKIFRNYYQQADASIHLRYLEKIDELEKLYSTEEFSSFDKKTIKMFIDKYARVYENELIKKASSYSSGVGKKFRIDAKSLEILKEVDEANYYDNIIGWYLKAIYEEYATKPKHIREQIFFADILSEINKSIKNEKKLKISLISKLSSDEKKRYVRKFYVSPYRIEQDKTKSYNYLIGYSEEIKEFETEDEEGRKVRSSNVTEKSPCCFRLSRIERADMMSSMGAHISKEHANELEKMLVERNVMFMSSEPIDIKVIFTDTGLESFRRTLYLRPQFYEIDKNDKHIYTFHCTEIQATNYFIRLGWDAKIIEPEYLRDKLINRYERALKSYMGMSKEEILESEKRTEVKDGG